MAEKDKVYKGKLKQAGIFNFKDFYSFSYDWLVEENYDVFERRYSEKVAGDSKDIEIEWEAMKEVSDYFRFVIKMEWKILGMKKVKVKRGDKEETMDTGSVEIKFSGTIVKDYESRWESTPVLKFMRGVYDRYIIKRRIDEYEIKLMGEIEELIAQCKSFLAMEPRG